MSIQLDEESKLHRKVVESNGLSKPFINAMNHAITYTLPKLLKQLPTIKLNNNRIGVFTNPTIYRPAIPSSNGEIHVLYPAEARDRNITFEARLFSKFEVREYDIKTKQYKLIKTSDVFLGHFPVMIGSILDPNEGSSLSEKYSRRESEVDCEAYFIIKGDEYVLQNEEHLRTNTPFPDLDDDKIIIRYTSATTFETSINTIIEDTKIEKNSLMVSFNNINQNKRMMNRLYLCYLFKNNDFSISNAEEDIIEPFLKEIENYFYQPDEKIYEFRKNQMRYYLRPTIDSFLNQINIDNEILNETQNTYKNLSPEELLSKARGKYILKNIKVYLNANTPTTSDIGLFLEYRNLVALNFLKNIEFNGGDEKNVIMTQIAIKRRTLAYMVYQYIGVKLGYVELLNKDGYQNKMIINSAGHFMKKMSSILEYMVKQLQFSFDKSNDQKDMNILKNSILETHMRESFSKAFRTRTWSVKKTNNDSVIVDMLNRTNSEASMISIRRITTPTNRRSEMRKKRFNNNTQFCVICPTYTPEGKSCGLIKDPASMFYLSLSRERWLVLSKIKEYFSNVFDKYKNPLFLNGQNIGFCNSLELHKICISYRRTGQIPFDTACILNSNLELWLSTEAGRPMIPYLVVSDNQTLVIDEKNLRGADLKTLLEEGAIEYIDVAENIEKTTLLAINVEKLQAKRKQIINIDNKIAQANDENERNNLINEKSKIQKYNYCMIDENAINGVAANSIPYMEHNPSARNTYQSSFIKQRLASNSLRSEWRYDTNLKSLVYSSIPLIGTAQDELLKLDRHGHGDTVMVAVVIYGGETQEDALQFSKNSIESGMYMYNINHGFSITFKQTQNFKETQTIPVHDSSDDDKYSKLGKDNIVRINSYVKAGDCLVGKVVENTQTGESYDQSLYVEQLKEGVVEDVLIQNNEKIKLIQIRLREIKLPEIGDKFSSQYAQKGTIGGIVETKNMPYIISDNVRTNGIIPDVLFNPQGMPTRMTIGLFYEFIAGQYALETGVRQNATAFRKIDIEAIQRQLENKGYSYDGTYTMINGETGQEFKSKIFFGPVYYQALPHLVKFKKQARGTGGRQVLTRQPVSGIRKSGGLRVGEMERDVLIVYGSCYLLNERLFISSDPYKCVICNKCGQFASTQGSGGDYTCRLCDNDIYLRQIFIPYPIKLLSDNLSGLNYKMLFHTKD